MAAYKRVLLKISGEQLSGDQGYGLDPQFMAWLADEISIIVKKGVTVAAVVGGGNFVRGAEVNWPGIHRVTADQMGMLGGVMNSMAVTDVFESRGLKTRCLTNIFADQVAESYSYRRAMKHLEKGRVVVIGGSIGRPYFTSDTGAVNLALELQCEVVLKATNVDGIYDKDPNKHDDAKKYDNLTHQQAIENPDVKVMDKAALGLALEQGMKVVVYDINQPESLAKIVDGQSIGTLVTA